MMKSVPGFAGQVAEENESVSPMTTPKTYEDSEKGWTANVVGMSVEILDRMEQAVLKVRERLRRSTAAMEDARIPYAVIGGNAVASWVATKDEGAVRNTPDVDLLIRRDDLMPQSPLSTKPGSLTSR